MVVAGTVVIRTALTAPFDVWHAKAVAKLQVVKPTLSEAESEEFKEPMDKAVSKAHGAGTKEAVIDKEVKMENQRFTQDFIKEQGNPGKAILVPWVIKNAVVQFPVFVTSTLALWNISGYDPGAGSVTHIPSPGMMTEQLLWMPNIAIPDSYFVIPSLLLAANSLNVVVRYASKDTNEKGVAWQLGHGSALLVSLLALQTPAIIALFWLTWSASALLQNSALKNPAVLRRLGVPKTPSELDLPVFRHLWVNFVARQRERPW